jgi:hypothetical protein
MTKFSAENFVEESKKVQGDKFSYDRAIYINSTTKVELKCNTCNNYFWQKPYSHKIGIGCPICSTGFNPNMRATLYYIKIETEWEDVYYKIGVTNNDAKTRFMFEKVKITPIKEFGFVFGQRAYELEQEILKEYSEYKYLGEDILISGNTEIFTRDVLGLDLSDNFYYTLKP